MKKNEELENLDFDDIDDEEYFDPFEDANYEDCDDYSNGSVISNALIAGLSVAGILAVMFAFVAALSYFGVWTFKKAAKLLKS